MDKEKEQNKAEVANLRGQAKAFSIMGALGAGALAVVEAGDILFLLSGAAECLPKSKAGKAVAITAATVAVGAITAAYVKHSHADRLEASRRHGHERQR